MPWFERRKGWLGPSRHGHGESSHSAAPRPDVQEPSHEVILPGVLYHPLRCPSCDSKQIICRHTHKDIEHRRIVRQHACRECGWKFKSIETMKPQDT